MRSAAARAWASAARSDGLADRACATKYERGAGSIEGVPAPATVGHANTNSTTAAIARAGGLVIIVRAWVTAR